jgi:signal transduction histidine kinase
MSKTSDASSTAATATAYWKQYAASATSFGRRYREDLFFRTETNVILLQIAFAVFLLVIVASAFSVLYRDFVTNFIQGVMESVRSGTGIGSAGSIAQNLQYLKLRGITVVSTVVLMGTAVFGYLIARLTLSPTRRALESQKQFIANVAHELRTPLAIIKTNTEVRLFDADVPPAARAIHEDNLEELDRISAIINNLLSLSSSLRPERIEFADVDLGLAVDSAVAHLSDLAERKDIPVIVKKSEYRMVWGNAAALEQVVMNVLKNALNYTRKGGDAVFITIEPDHRGHIEVTVRDSGAGIPESDLFHIFEPFFRGDQSRTRSGSGSGLGLSIVNELVKLHRGSIRIRSAPQRGTSVHITLPIGRGADSAEDDLPAGSGSLGEISVDFARK